LARFGPQADIGRIAEAWPGAVGPDIARNAWPARIGRDGTLHVHTSSSTWAFELEHLASDIRARLGKLAPVRLRFAPGPLPEPKTAVAEETRQDAPLPTEDDIRIAADLATEIADEKLRKLVARAAAASLAGGRSGRTFC
jgi:hypothetical protein